MQTDATAAPKSDALEAWRLASLVRVMRVAAIVGLPVALLSAWNDRAFGLAYWLSPLLWFGGYVVLGIWPGEASRMRERAFFLISALGAGTSWILKGYLLDAGVISIAIVAIAALLSGRAMSLAMLAILMTEATVAAWLHSTGTLVSPGHLALGGRSASNWASGLASLLVSAAAIAVTIDLIVRRLEGARQAAEDSATELRKLSSELEMRVDERTRELSEAVQELEQFTSSVSHDLRAPLRHIAGFSEALDEAAGHTLDGEAKGHLNRVRDASRRMSELVEGLLQLSRVTRAPLEKSDIDLSQLAAAILDDLRAHDRERQIDILLAPGLTTRGSPQLLRVAMQNLLDNAWKYTRRTDRPQLELGQKQLEREVAYYVKDNGAGFDPAYAQKLFQPFQRLHPASQFEGTGIGLATVARIVQRHGGRIWAEGRPGEGATFWFTLG